MLRDEITLFWKGCKIFSDNRRKEKGDRKRVGSQNEADMTWNDSGCKMTTFGGRTTANEIN